MRFVGHQFVELAVVESFQTRQCGNGVRLALGQTLRPVRTLVARRQPRAIHWT